ncbi:TetR/AcrR family transcriptional regulator [Gordonia alkanivorans]|uniref:TetR/AcrR family transcriptional regulator n=1 Tax=Gordonia alkanivorans TaxID=84096 RepID=UPI00244D3E39|nr:TetR/AcrR family transcriptional regulator [Gordonia alkanivorans]MDH3047240.1 TetR/AcrR family transcriptional regulator [Gordonia alkanivorans]
MTLETSTSDAPSTSADHDELADLGPRALKAREAILDAARKLFLERGYAGTRINNITDECGASRAGFYTYFKSKMDVVEVLGRTTYRDCLAVVGTLDTLSRPTRYDEVRAWVQSYFDFMDEHGAFMNALSESGPTDEDFRATANRLTMRTAFLVGIALRSRQTTPTDAPEALGLSIVSMVERTWNQIHVRRLPIDDQEAVAAIAHLIMGTVTG